MKPRKSLLNSVQAYYQTLKDFEFQHALHEGAVSVAFQTLLGDAGRDAPTQLLLRQSQSTPILEQIGL